MELVLQSVVFPNDVCNNKKLCFDADNLVEFRDGFWHLNDNTKLSTRTYMNLFDSAIWKKYTGIDNCFLEFETMGKAIIRIYSWSKNSIELISEYQLYSLALEKVKLKVEIENTHMIFFEITAINSFKIKKISYIAEIPQYQIKHVHLSIIICTYKRNNEIKKNINILKRSLFFDNSSSYFGKMSVRIVDNASELRKSNEEFFKVYHNPNTGGTGGFTRGILESRIDEDKFKISHVIFMDDDVEFVEETFYRLYALLCLLLSCYQNSVIAGRMFRLDKREIQYTASEVWNGGDLIHIGHNHDMCRSENLLEVNEREGEYSGWWFACYTMKFVKRNLPLPFFLHCDDVEYGLRHGGKPILLNGIQVWHQTYEHRNSPVIKYYDIRNALIVNVLCGKYCDEKEVFASWNRKLFYCLKGDFSNSYAVIVAFEDYLKGKNFLESQRERKKITSHNQIMNLVIVLFMWLALIVYSKIKGKTAFNSYKNILNSKRYREDY